MTDNDEQVGKTPSNAYVQGAGRSGLLGLARTNVGGVGFLPCARKRPRGDESRSVEDGGGGRLPVRIARCEGGR